jgi:hypothetical protein
MFPTSHISRLLSANPEPLLQNEKTCRHAGGLPVNVRHKGMTGARRSYMLAIAVIMAGWQ